MGPMDAIGAPQQVLSQGVGAPGIGGAGPTIPQSLMPPGAMPGLGGTGMDPRKIMAYIQSLQGGIGGGGASGGGGGGGGGGFDISTLPGAHNYSGPGSSNPLINPIGLFK